MYAMYVEERGVLHILTLAADGLLCTGFLAEVAAMPRALKAPQQVFNQHL
jgi:hypothetical protein